MMERTTEGERERGRGGVAQNGRGGELVMEGEGQGRTKRSQEGQEEDSDVMWDWVFPAGLDLKYGLYGLSAYGKDWSSDAAISSGGNDLLRHLHRKRGALVQWLAGQTLDKFWTNVQYLSKVCPRFVHVQVLSKLCQI